MADHDTSIHFVTDEQRGGDPADNENEHVQFEECDVETCKYYNEEGYCSFETCRINLENPATACMITRKCLFCGDEYAVNYNEILFQACPQCLKEAVEAEGHPHECMFCGSTMDLNRSLFFRICENCIECLMEVINGDPASVELAMNEAHCGSVPSTEEAAEEGTEAAEEGADAASEAGDAASEAGDAASEVGDAASEASDAAGDFSADISIDENGISGSFESGDFSGNINVDANGNISGDFQAGDFSGSFDQNGFSGNVTGTDGSISFDSNGNISGNYSSGDFNAEFSAGQDGFNVNAGNSQGSVSFDSNGGVNIEQAEEKKEEEKGDENGGS